jgi:DNA-binding CsgD family transcriptional regulator
MQSTLQGSLTAFEIARIIMKTIETIYKHNKINPDAQVSSK